MTTSKPSLSPHGGEVTADMIERAAWGLCYYAGDDPERLEPGNVIKHPTDNLEKWESAEGVHLDHLADSGQRPPDGINSKGEKCHFAWRHYIGEAQAALEAVFTWEDPQ